MEKNIVLIGMSGCGKSAIGKLLAKRIGTICIDMDDEIEKNAEMTINEIFANFGEKYFRDLETKCAQEMSKKHGVIISTGGGAVIREENMEYLKQNGIAVYIERSVDEIIKSMEVEKRPLMANGTDVLYEMEKKRAPLYKKYADITVSNNKEIEACENKLIEELKSKGIVL